MIAVAVVELLVVLAQEVGAVVASVGRAHNRVHVVGAVLGVVQLDQHSRSRQPVVVTGPGLGCAGPGEPQAGRLRALRTVGEAAQVELDESLAGGCGVSGEGG